MIRRPPRSTLFPYTDALPISPPLSLVDPKKTSPPRSLRPHLRHGPLVLQRYNLPIHPLLIRQPNSSGPSWSPGGKFSTRKRMSRSEEHTSELQSRQYLVCRLL